jgi:sterol 3beta-glucosyltransferase
MLNRIATVKDDGTVVVDIPSNLEPASLDIPAEDLCADVVDEEAEAGDVQYRPPMNIVILIVGTRGDVQPFVAIGKRLQVIFLFTSAFGEMLLKLSFEVTIVS